MKNFEETLELLESVVAENGTDFVYPDEWKDSIGTCLYVKPDGSGPACIVGNVLHRAGVPLDELSQMEGQAADTVSGRYGFDSEASMLLWRAQDEQDAGNTWGDALEFAKTQAAVDRENDG